MQTIAIDSSVGVCQSATLSVCLSAKMAKPIEVQCGVDTLEDPRNNVGSSSTRRGGGIRCGLRQTILALVILAQTLALQCVFLAVTASQDRAVRPKRIVTKFLSFCDI